jgi:hypothetical protein
MLHDAVVLHGGVIHWMVHNTDEIVSYNICTMEQGTIRPPVLAASFKGLLCLGSYYSNDGQKLLRLLASKGVKIYVWHQLANGQWASEPVTIDMEEKLLSLYPGINISHILLTEFIWSGEGSNMVVLHTYPYNLSSSRRLIVLDIETKEMHLHQTSTPWSSVLLEIDLPSRLRAMKPFPQ